MLASESPAVRDVHGGQHRRWCLPAVCLSLFSQRPNTPVLSAANETHRHHPCLLIRKRVIPFTNQHKTQLPRGRGLQETLHTDKLTPSAWQGYCKRRPAQQPQRESDHLAVPLTTHGCPTRPAHVLWTDLCSASTASNSSGHAALRPAGECGGQRSQLATRAIAGWGHAC